MWLSGLLCCRNVSSDGEYARRKLRDCDGFVDALFVIVRAAINNGDMDNKSVENCICILRNLSFACQETIDPEYLQKRAANSGSMSRGIIHYSVTEVCYVYFLVLLVQNWHFCVLDSYN